MNLVPITRLEAKAYIDTHHRHLRSSLGGVFQIAAQENGEIVGVVMVGRPISRVMDDSWTLEVNRLATDGTKNCCSMLYGASWRATKALGYRKLITYTLASEPGTSLRAAGWSVVGELRGRLWGNCNVRPRVDLNEKQDKILWVAG